MPLRQYIQATKVTPPRQYIHATKDTPLRQYTHATKATPLRQYTNTTKAIYTTCHKGHATKAIYHVRSPIITRALNQMSHYKISHEPAHVEIKLTNHPRNHATVHWWSICISCTTKPTWNIKSVENSYLIPPFAICGANRKKKETYAHRFGISQLLVPDFHPSKFLSTLWILNQYHFSTLQCPSKMTFFLSCQ